MIPYLFILSFLVQKINKVVFKVQNEVKKKKRTMAGFRMRCVGFDFK